ncbi:FadD3 family acyl-CoA ligase [Rhodococcoides kyotonense]|uniref:FadD3 family acyl-CoA ligase n=1 Tax=Rhodococcoides kyotonense TaxID=398843 RepID=UPI001594F825|nr:FadD3 family acyl-CoA ligase [Rhodococcus kyotonensis]
MSIEMHTSPAALRRAVEQFGDLDAVVDDDVRWTFRDLHRQVAIVARALVARGVAAGDRVAIWAPNTHHWVASALAVHYAGAIVVPINTRYKATEAHDILTRSRAVALFVAGEFLGVDRFAELKAVGLPVGLLTVIRLGGQVPQNDTAIPWSDLRFLGAAATEDAVETRADGVGADDVSDILFTSGTTGRSKGVLSAHRQLIGVARAWADCATLNSDDRYLVINPFFHSFGYKAGMVAALLTGACIVPHSVYDAETAMGIVERERITVLPGAPTIFSTILDHPSRPRHDLSTLRVAVTGAAVVPVALVERMQNDLKLDVVLTAYGLTEAVVATMCRPGDDARTVATTSGRATADMEVKIASSGEILLRGPNVMLGYLDDHAATSEAIDDDGWLHTGDIGILDGRGYLTITDRLKDMYIAGGFNVYPAEIEQSLARLPGVAESAVVGIPDDRLGEVGHAFVVPREGSTLTADDVVAYCREQMANFKVPRVVTFRESLPRNASGKVLKTELR